MTKLARLLDDLTGPEISVLVHSRYVRVNSFDDLEMLLSCIYEAQQFLLLPPELGILAGHLAFQLGHIEHSRMNYEIVFNTYFRSPSSEAAILLARIVLCHLRVGAPDFAWGLLNFEHRTGRLSDRDTQQFFFQAVHAAAAQQQGVLTFEPPDLPALQEAQAASVDDFTDFLAMTVLLETWADAGKFEKARECLEFYELGFAEPWQSWHRMEAALAQALLAFREENALEAIGWLDSALEAVKTISPHGGEAGQGIRHLSFHERVYLRRFLSHIRLGNPTAAQNDLEHLKELRIKDPSLQYRVLQAQAILEAYTYKKKPEFYIPESRGPYTELQLVIHLMRDGYNVVAARAYPRGMLASWHNWNP